VSTITLYYGSVGINNKVPPHRLPFNPETGVSALAHANNVLISRTGELSSRRGQVKSFSGNYHSLFRVGIDGLIAKDRASDTAIYKIIVSGPDNIDLFGIASGLAKNRRIEFCNVNGTIYYTNGVDNGMIVDWHETAWKENTWPSDTTTEFRKVPPADHLAYNAGRIYFSIGPEIYYTVFGMPGIYTPKMGERFPTKILMITGVADGVYVSDTESIYFLSGLDPTQWTSRKVASYPAIEWGKYQDPIDPSFFGIESNSPSALLATENGPIICMPSGQIINLIDKNVSIPKCSNKGSIGLFDETLIIQSME